MKGKFKRKQRKMENEKKEEEKGKIDRWRREENGRGGKERI